MSKNNTPDTENNGEEHKGQRWVEENLRLIISIIIVVAIAAGIYSYSQRSQETQVAFDDTQDQVLVDEDTDKSMSDNGTTEEESMTVTEENPDQEEDSDQKDSAMETVTEETIQDETTMQDNQGSQPAVKSAETSKETTDAIIVKASPGDGLTNLARQALAEYLTKNPDSQITAAHKIYIEDYLRKSVDYTGHVYPGTEVSFSKDLIKRALDQSKNLTDAQLSNLQKYVARVPSLS